MMLGLAVSAAAVGQDAPTTQPAQAEPAFTVTLASAVGPVQVKDCSDEQAAWTPAAEGDTLGELHVIRTGFGGSAEVRFGENSTARIEPCSQIGVRQFRPDAQTTRTRVDLKYGQLEVRVEQESGPNDYQVSTPVGTLAARGSSQSLSFTDLGLQAQARTGDWTLATGAGAHAMTGGESSNQNLAKWFEKIPEQFNVQLGPQGLTTQELTNLLNNAGGQGIAGFVGPNAFHNAALPGRLIGLDVQLVYFCDFFGDEYCQALTLALQQYCAVQPDCSYLEDLIRSIRLPSSSSSSGRTTPYLIAPAPAGGQP